MAMLDWVRFPTHWIEAEEHHLRDVTWAEDGIDGLAGLMVLIVIVQHTDQETGEAKVTYDLLQKATGLSRSTIARGLGFIEGKLVEKLSQSRYRIAGYDAGRGWAMLPAKPLYTGKGQISFFQEFRCRKAVELNALKLYLLFVSRRDRNDNMAHVTYDMIEDYTGIERDHIKSALSFLAANGMIHIEHVPSKVSKFGVANAYRITRLEAYRHMGTTGRQYDARGFFNGPSE